MVNNGFRIATTQSSKLCEDSVEMESPTKKPLGVSYWRIFPTAIMPPKVEIDGFFTVIQRCCWGQNSSWLFTFAQKWQFFFFWYVVYIWFPYFVIIILSISLSYLILFFLLFCNLLFTFIWSIWWMFNIFSN